MTTQHTTALLTIGLMVTACHDFTITHKVDAENLEVTANINIDDGHPDADDEPTPLQGAIEQLLLYPGVDMSQQIPMSGEAALATGGVAWQVDTAWIEGLICINVWDGGQAGAGICMPIDFGGQPDPGYLSVDDGTSLFTIQTDLDRSEITILAATPLLEVGLTNSQFDGWSVISDGQLSQEAVDVLYALSIDAPGPMTAAGCSFWAGVSAGLTLSGCAAAHVLGSPLVGLTCLSAAGTSLNHLCNCADKTDGICAPFN